MAQRQLSPTTSFNSSPFVRLLASLDVAPVADSTRTIAEKLSHWVAWTDAIAISAALDGGTAARPSGTASRVHAGTHTVIEQFRQVRDDLARSIAQDTVLGGGRSGRALPAVPHGDADFAACRRRYLALQRSMEDRIGNLRADVREALSTASSALARLAALDLAMDTALGGHQRRLLAGVPAMLEKRCTGMRTTHRKAPSPEHDMQPDRQKPGATAVGQLMQSVLRAELALRLQPVQGLIDALGNDTAGQA